MIKNRVYKGIDIDVSPVEGWYRANVPNGVGGLVCKRADTLAGIKQTISSAIHQANDYCGYPDGYCAGICRTCGAHLAWGCGH